MPKEEHHHKSESPFEASSKSPASILSEEVAVSKSPASDEDSFYFQRRPKVVPGPDAPKVVIDFTKKKNNVSIKHLKSHQFKMLKWRNFTLETLISQQDCAVDAVKLEALLRMDLEAKKRFISYFCRAFFRKISLEVLSKMYFNLIKFEFLQVTGCSGGRNGGRQNETNEKGVSIGNC